MPLLFRHLSQQAVHVKIALWLVIQRRKLIVQAIFQVLHNLVRANILLRIAHRQLSKDDYQGLQTYLGRTILQIESHDLPGIRINPEMYHLKTCRILKFTPWPKKIDVSEPCKESCQSKIHHLAKFLQQAVIHNNLRASQINRHTLHIAKKNLIM